MGIGTGFARLLLVLLVGWTAIGAVGVTISFRRGDRIRGRRNMAWIGVIWLGYAAVLLAVSLTARPRIVPAGQEQCLDSLCFTVVGTESVPGYLARHGEKIVRVSLRIANHSDKRSPGDGHVEVYLVDSHGRRWDELPGLEGVHLSTPIGAKGMIVSAPVFKVPQDAEDLRLVLTHGHRLPYLLVIGDPDSLMHPLLSFSLGQ